MGKLVDIGQPIRRIEATASGIGPQWCSVMRYGDCQATTVWGIFICHCEERSDVAISGVIYNETWGLPCLRLAVTNCPFPNRPPLKIFLVDIPRLPPEGVPLGAPLFQRSADIHRC